MKMRIFNPDNTEVNMKILGVRVVIAPRRAELVDVNIGRALQEVQPQLHYNQIDEDLVKKAEKDIKTELNKRLKSAETEKDIIKENAKQKVKKAHIENEELKEKVKEKDKKIYKRDKKITKVERDAKVKIEKDATKIKQLEKQLKAKENKNKTNKSNKSQTNEKDK